MVKLTRFPHIAGPTAALILLFLSRLTGVSAVESSLKAITPDNGSAVSLSSMGIEEVGVAQREENFQNFNKKNSEIEPLGNGNNISREKDVSDSHFSEIIKLGAAHYFLRNVCLRPLEAGGLQFFYDTKKSGNKPQNSVKICAEVSICEEFKIQLVPTPAPGRNSKQIMWFNSSEATAMIEPMTGVAGWHMLHHFLSSTQLLSQQMEKVQAPAVHLHPMFFSGQFRKLFSVFSNKTGFQFSSKVAPFWPLVEAIVPPNMELLQFDFLESTPSKTVAKGSTFVKQETQGGSDTLCYESVLLGSPRMETRLGYQGNTKWWGEIQSNLVRPFRDRVLRLAGARGLNSGFCKFDPEDRPRAKVSSMGSIAWEGTAKAPLLVFVLRKKFKRAMDTDVMAAMFTRFGFRVKEVMWEDLDLWEQIRTARSADVMVGAHGNGLTHVFWMRSGSVLVEIFPPGTHPRIDERWNSNRKSNFGSLASFAGVHHIAFRSVIQAKLNWNGRETRSVVVPSKKLISVLSAVVLKMEKVKSCLNSRAIVSKTKVQGS